MSIIIKISKLIKEFVKKAFWVNVLKKSTVSLMLKEGKMQARFTPD
jgi:hypothetical protein